MATHVMEFPKNAQEMVRISISEYRGKTYGDIRVYYQDDEGEWRPTKKGVTLAPDRIPELRTGVGALEATLRENGLLEDEEIA